MNSAQATDTVSVYFNNERKHETEFVGSVGRIEVNGECINDIHDLTIEVARNGKIIRGIAIFCAVVAVACLGLIIYAGFYKDWQQQGNSIPEASISAD